jgi:hypothetical protein
MVRVSSNFDRSTGLLNLKIVLYLFIYSEKSHFAISQSDLQINEIKIHVKIL